MNLYLLLALPALIAVALVVATVLTLRLIRQYCAGTRSKQRLLITSAVLAYLLLTALAAREIAARLS